MMVTLQMQDSYATPERLPQYYTIYLPKCQAFLGIFLKIFFSCSKARKNLWQQLIHPKDPPQNMRWYRQVFRPCQTRSHEHKYRWDLLQILLR